MTLEVLFIMDGQPRTLLTGLHSGLAVNRNGLIPWLLPPEMVHSRIVSRTAPAGLKPASIIADNEALSSSSLRTALARTGDIDGGCVCGGETDKFKPTAGNRSMGRVAEMNCPLPVIYGCRLAAMSPLMSARLFPLSPSCS